MEKILKNLLETLSPLLIKYLMDNRHLLIDFLREEAKKTDNKIDDFVVDILSDYLDGL